MYATINNQSIPFKALQYVTLSKDILTISGETTTEVQWLKVERILEPLSLGDTIEFRVELQEDSEFVHKRGKGKISVIDKSQSAFGFHMRFTVKILIIHLLYPKINKHNATLS